MRFLAVQRRSHAGVAMAGAAHRARVRPHQRGGAHRRLCAAPLHARAAVSGAMSVTDE